MSLERCEDQRQQNAQSEGRHRLRIAHMGARPSGMFALDGLPILQLLSAALLRLQMCRHPHLGHSQPAIVATCAISCGLRID
jgi:hypothetical protein